MIDYGPANFDNRHRIAVSGIWEVPFARNLHGPAKAILDGWELAPILTARTGAPYSIYDFTNDEFVATRVAADQVLPVTGGRTNTGQTLVRTISRFIISPTTRWTKAI